MMSASRIAEIHKATGLGWVAARDFAEAAPTTLVDRIIEAFARQGGSVPLHDPIETDSNYSEVISAVRQQVEFETLRELGRYRLGACHLIWARMKQRLKNQHGIDWYSPREMNPASCFD